MRRGSGRLVMAVLTALAVCSGGRAAGEEPEVIAPGPPPSGPVVYEGTVAGIYTPAGRVKLMVDTVRFPGGLELDLREPRPALLLLGATGHQMGRSYPGACRAADLKPGEGISVSVRYTVENPGAPGRLEAIRRPVSGNRLIRKRGTLLAMLPDTGYALPPVGGVTLPPGMNLTPIPDMESAPPEKSFPSIIFPVLGHATWKDTYGADRDEGSRKHIGQDLMAPKMRPVLAAFHSVVTVSRSPESCSLRLRGPDGWTAAYLHLNNDRPDTDDGLGSEDYAFAAGLSSGDWVVAGQMLGWVGDSGNAENTDPHLHFELHRSGNPINPAPALRQAQRLPVPRLPHVLPEESPAPGEVRLDGFVRAIDPGRGALQLDLRSESGANGRTRVVTRPERRWIVAPRSITPCFVGERDTPVEFAAISIGTPVLAIGPSSGQNTLTVRRLLVDQPAFLADPALAKAITDYAARLAGGT